MRTVIHLWALGFVGHLLSVLTFLLTLAFVAVVLRSRKTPTSMIAWLGVIVLVPYVGIPLFLLFGVRKSGHGRGAKASLYGPASRPPLPAGAALDRFERVLELAGAPRPKPNSELRLLTTGEDAYHVLMEGIRNATREIDVSIYILARDPSGMAILSALTERARSGVRVRLLLDAWGASWLARPSLREFRRAGGESAFFMPLLHRPSRGSANLRNHRKLAIFDGARVWMGGMNFAQEYLGPSPLEGRWLDLALFVQGSSVADVQGIFEGDWAFARGGNGTAASRVTDAPPGPGRHRAQLIGSGPDTPGDPIYDVLLESAFEAKERIWIVTPYFVPDETLAKSLALARQRGVDVRIVVPARSNHPMADLSRGSYLKQLREGGARVFQYPRMLHAKMILVDRGFALVGSANFDLRSLLYNYEIGAFLRDPDDIAACARWQEELFSRCEERALPSGLFRDLAEGMGRIFGPLL